MCETIIGVLARPARTQVANASSTIAYRATDNILHERHFADRHKRPHLTGGTLSNTCVLICRDTISHVLLLQEHVGVHTYTLGRTTSAREHAHYFRDTVCTSPTGKTRLEAFKRQNKT